MSRAAMNRWAGLGVAVGVTMLAPRAAQAGDKEWDSARGWGDTALRLGLEVVRESSVLPLAPTTPPPGTPPTATGASTARYGVDARFSLYGYFDQTVFGTLLGGELDVWLGYRGGNDLPAGTSDPGADKTPFHMKMDGAFDYDVLHWKSGTVRGRIVGGLGGGFELDARKWPMAQENNDWRGYPLLLAKVQLWFGEIGGHLSYGFIPVTTDSFPAQEHRFELTVGIHPIAFGARLEFDHVEPSGLAPSTLTRFSGYVAWAF